MEHKTPLYDRHAALGGRIVPFAGYLLPVQYSGLIEEHTAVRQRAGLFDVSHMGELLLTGPDALHNLNHILTNDFTGMTDGRVRYSPMCNPGGGVIDDVLVYRFHDEKYFIVVNASNRHKDFEWMRGQVTGNAELLDVSDSWAQLALQGPLSRDVLTKLSDPEQLPAKYYTHKNVEVAGVPCLISQTGYTGEFGYELYCAPEQAGMLWDAILEAGAEYGLLPCGLGARDTLRMEASMPLYGHEMDETVTPLETGLGFAVKLQKPDFIGKAALEAAGAPKRARIGLRLTGRGIAREGCEVYQNGAVIGHVTSGTHLPTLGGAYAMALVNAPMPQTGDTVEIEVRGRRISAEIVPLPFYKRT